MTETVEIDRMTLATLTDEARNMYDAVNNKGGHWKDVRNAILDAEDSLQGEESER
jgi:hypothetical protein